MRTRWLRAALALAWLLAADQAAAQIAGYRWVDDKGSVHYAGRRDQVPEAYRGQLAPEGPGEPPKPRLPHPPQSARAHAPGECVLRFRGTAAKAGFSRVYPTCESCWKELAALGAGEKPRAECIASSVKSYR